jgi:hypothetical protein
MDMLDKLGRPERYTSLKTLKRKPLGTKLFQGKKSVYFLGRGDL